MLFRRPILDAIAAGSVTLAFRRWKQPRVKPGGHLRTAVGVLEIDAVAPVDAEALTDRDARRAGHPSRAALLQALDARGTDDPIYRVQLHLAGPDPRVALRERIPRDRVELNELRAKLAAIDARSRRGPWTRAMLDLIAANEGVRAPDLAASVDRPVPRFKADVRRLKELGLTESLVTGYRISPRGRVLLEHLVGAPSAS